MSLLKSLSQLQLAKSKSEISSPYKIDKSLYSISTKTEVSSKDKIAQKCLGVVMGLINILLTSSFCASQQVGSEQVKLLRKMSSINENDKQSP